MDPSLNTGIQIGPHIPTGTALHTRRAASTPQDPATGGRGGAEASGKESDKAGDNGSRAVRQQALHSPKERRDKKASGQPQAPQHLHSEETLQNGRCAHGEGLVGGRGLDGFSGPQGRLPGSPNSRSSQEVLALQVEVPDIRVPVPTVWPLQCPTGVHEDHEARHGNSEGAWDTLRDFHRRHPPDGILTAEYREHPEGNDLPTGAPGFLNKQREVHSHTLPEDQLPGLCDRLPEDDNQPTGGEAERDTGGMPGCPETGEGHSEGSVENDRKDDCSSASSPPSPTSLQSSPILEELCIPPLPVVRNPGSPQPRSPEGSSMVDRGGEALERQVPEGNTPRPVNRDGCLPPRMGRIGAGRVYWRVVVNPGEAESHKRPRAARRGLCTEKSGEGVTSPHQTHDGQHDSHLLHQSHGGHEIQKPSSTCSGAMAVVPGQRSHRFGGAPPRSEQRHSRQGIENSPQLVGVETEPCGIPKHSQHPGPMYGGPICHTVEHPIDQVHELEARPFRHGNRCPEGPMEAVAGICLPSVCPDREMSAQDQAGTSSNSADSPSLAHTSVVSSSPRITSPDPNSPTIPPGPPQGSIQSDPPTSARRQPSTGRMESVRNRCRAEGISQEATQLISAGWSRGTNAAYESGWSKWNSWCLQRDCDPLSCGPTSLVNFLADMFKHGLQHRSINTIRSAISMTHDPIEGTPIGQHPSVSRIMRGIHNTRPPRPRYTSTWDVDKVIRYVESLGSNDSLSLKHLSMKLAVLFALVEASRSSELAALDLRFRQFRPEGVSFILPSLTKKRNPGAPPKEVFFGSFPENGNLCVTNCLRCYEDRTKEFRSSAEGLPKKLFLSYIRPHKPVTSQRIAHWIKDLLGLAGIDTSIFKAHSTRGAATTAAHRKGVRVSDILQVADWSTESTFNRYYYRPNRDPAFARSVLSSIADNPND